MIDRRSLVSLAAVAGLGLIGLSGCSGTAGDASGEAAVSAARGTLDPKNPTKITFYSYSLSSSSAEGTMNDIINSFNDTVGAEKGVVVEGVAEEATGALTKTTSDIQAGNQVNVIQHNFISLDTSRINLGIQAYEDIFGTEAMDEAFKGIDEGAKQLGVIDDKTYGMAFTFSTPVLYANATLFRQAGLDPAADIPTTWDDMYTVCKTIKDATGLYPLHIGTSMTSIWVMESIIRSNGGAILNDDRTEAVFASDEGVEAIEMWKRLYEEGLCAPMTDTEAMNLFTSGQLGMQLYTTALYSLYQGAAASAGWELTGGGEPSFGGEPAVPTNSGSCLAVRASTDTEAAACWEFIKYATSAESYTRITEGIGYLPLRADIVDDPAYLKAFADENPLIRTNLAQLKNIKPSTIWPGDSATELSQIFVDAIAQAVTTDADVRETLEAAQEQINGMIG